MAAVLDPTDLDDDGSLTVLALLFFLQHPNYDVRAVTISAGEAHPGLFTPLTRRFLAALGRPDIPVGAGREAPLMGDNAFPEPWRQSSDAFWGISLPESQAVSDDQPSGASLAAQLIIDTISSSSQPVALFISGTHTNLAEALRLDPTIKQRILAVYVMGGSVYQPGNIKSAWPEINNESAEWNIWVDPLAASEVFNSGIPIHLMPLDGTIQLLGRS
jgi:purine nucleosidase/pyrimidine-specific ribonucleoside hydrolase